MGQYVVWHTSSFRQAYQGTRILMKNLVQSCQCYTWSYLLDALLEPLLAIAAPAIALLNVCKALRNICALLLNDSDDKLPTPAGSESRKIVRYVFQTCYTMRSMKC